MEEGFFKQTAEPTQIKNDKGEQIKLEDTQHFI
jgi:hypothetical protein